MKVFITGATGQLGKDLCTELNLRGHNLIGVGSRDLDITDSNAVMQMLEEINPDAVIHCAAFTAVDLAEHEKERCDAVNRIGTENIAKACSAAGSKLLYLSTDYVFDGSGERPWEPDDAAAPLNYYGLTKYQGEEAVRRFVSSHFIVRISWAFGVHGKNFVKTMLHLGAERERLTVVDDQVGSPTYTPDLSRLLADMIETEQYGTYHATNEGFCSWYEFASAIMKQSGLTTKVEPVSSSEYPTDARRPHNSRMSKSKLIENGFQPLPPWEDALTRFLEELMNE